MRISRRSHRARVAGLPPFYCGKAPYYPWTQEDFDALRRECAVLNCKPIDMLRVFALETSSSFNPAIAFCNSSGYPSAIGLNQITDVNAKAMKITEDERLSLLTMTPAEQLPFVTRSFLAARGYKPFETPPDDVTLYQTNIAPATVGSDTVYTKKIVGDCPPPSSAKDAYCANIGLDKNGDGVIDRADLRIRLDEFSSSANFKDMVQKLEGSSPVAPSRKAEGNTAFAAVIAAAGGFAIYRLTKK